MRKVDNGEKKIKKKRDFLWPLMSLPVDCPNADQLERRKLVPKMSFNLYPFISFKKGNTKKGHKKLGEN